ncbi:hypothetical protein GCM10020219_040570 [Nonomuraea dietziae]
MQPPRLPGVLLPLPDELRLGVGAEPQPPAEPAQVAGGRGHDVRTAQPVQLQQVLDLAQEGVGLGQAPGVLPADVAAPGQRGEGGKRGPAAQQRVEPSVHELEQLDGELDVAQPPWAELELPLAVLAHVRLDAAAHRLDVLHEVVAGGGVPDQLVDGRDVGRAQLGVARDRPGLEQRLELPGLGPAPVVGQVAGEGADQGARPALRAQPRVDLPELGAGAHHALRQTGGHAQRLGLVRALRGLGDEDHVDVADVVELARAALAHADHGQPYRRELFGREPARAGLGPRDREAGLQRGARQVGQLRGDLGEGGGAGDVAGGQAQQPFAVGALELASWRGHARPWLAVGGLGPDRAQEGGPQLALTGAQDGLLARQGAPVALMGDQVFAERGAHPQDAEQP